MSSRDDDRTTGAPSPSAGHQLLQGLTRLQTELFEIYTLREAHPDAWVGMFGLLRTFPHGRGKTLKENLVREVIEPGAPLELRMRYIPDLDDPLRPNPLKIKELGLKWINDEKTIQAILLTSLLFFLHHVRSFNQDGKWIFDRQNDLLAAQHAAIHYIYGFCGTKEKPVASVMCQNLREGPWWALVQEVGPQLHIQPFEF